MPSIDLNERISKVVPTAIWIWLLLNALPLFKPFRRGHKLDVTQQNDGLLKISQDGVVLYIADSSRLKIYVRPKGVERRIQVMRDKYLSQVNLTEIGTVVDVGANVGEFSLAASAYAEKIVAIEPEKSVFTALKANLGAHNAICVQALLGEKDGPVEFYSKSSTADSTIIKPKQTYGYTVSHVMAVTLDDLMAELQISKIDLLKLEAEGAEPEVLRGGHNTLRNTRYVVVDAGPERNGESTVVPVSQLLEGFGFRLLPIKNNIITAVNSSRVPIR